jgi:S1-C subfamily serine protease
MTKKKKVVLSAILALIAYRYVLSCPSESELMSKSVMLTGKGIECSGQQVKADSGLSYILTAAHCYIIADENGDMNVQTQDGRQLKRKIIAEDPSSDLMLLEGVPGMKGLTVADSLGRFQHIRTFTHGHQKPVYKTEGAVIGTEEIIVPISDITNEDEENKCVSQSKNKVVDLLIKKICVLDVEETVVTAQIIPGSSGGMVVDDSGQLVGIASATEGYFGYLVPLKDIKAFLFNY